MRSGRSGVGCRVRQDGRMRLSVSVIFQPLYELIHVADLFFFSFFLFLLRACDQERSPGRILGQIDSLICI